MREMQKVDVLLRKVAFEDEAEVAGGIADSRKQQSIKRREMFCHAHLERRLYDRADERSKACVGILNVELIAGAIQTNRQHSARMNDFYRSINRKVTNRFRARML